MEYIWSQQRTRSELRDLRPRLNQPLLLLLLLRPSVQFVVEVSKVLSVPPVVVVVVQLLLLLLVSHQHYLLLLLSLLLLLLLLSQVGRGI